MNRDAERIIEIYERHADARVDARLREASLYGRGGWIAFARSSRRGGSALNIGAVPVSRSQGVSANVAMQSRASIPRLR